MTYGNCRVTVLDPQGRAYVADVKEGDLWYFPAGYPHSLQGLGPDGAEFVLCFDNGAATEYNTLLLSSWMAHTPPHILAENFGVPVDALKSIPLHSLWIFQGELPGDLAADQAAVRSAAGDPPEPFTFPFSEMKPVKENSSGSVKIADSSTFKVSKTIAAGLVTLKPGALRDMHWHPNADEWQYWIKGTGSMTVFNTGPKAVTMNFNPGDIGYVKHPTGHYISNDGDTEVQFLAVFRSDHYAAVSLSDWLSHTPPALVAQHLSLDPATIAEFPSDRPDIMPE